MTLTGLKESIEITLGNLEFLLDDAKSQQAIYLLCRNVQ
jgi:hypothetical protein